MSLPAHALQMDQLHVTVRRVGRSIRILAASGALSFNTAPRLRSAYQNLLQTEQNGMHRLLIDLREVVRFDATGTTTLLELARDADRRTLQFEIADRADRPAYVATGLHQRLKFVSARAMEALER